MLGLLQHLPLLLIPQPGNSQLLLQLHNPAPQPTLLLPKPAHLLPELLLPELPGPQIAQQFPILRPQNLHLTLQLLYFSHCDVVTLGQLCVPTHVLSLVLVHYL